MYRTLVLALALLASATAFAPAAPASAARTVAHATKPIQEWDGVTKPFGFFDPAGMSKVEGSEALLPWCRMAEIKHGRVAMLASVGFIVQELGVHFPGAISAANYPCVL